MDSESLVFSELAGASATRSYIREMNSRLSFRVRMDGGADLRALMGDGESCRRMLRGLGSFGFLFLRGCVRMLKGLSIPTALRGGRRIQSTKSILPLSRIQQAQAQVTFKESSPKLIT